MTLCLLWPAFPPETSTNFKSQLNTYILFFVCISSQGLGASEKKIKSFFFFFGRT